MYNAEGSFDLTAGYEGERSALNRVTGEKEVHLATSRDRGY